MKIYKFATLLCLAMASSVSFAITNGKLVKLNVPLAHEVVLIHMTQDQKEFQTGPCSGLFIGDQIVLTAAHCVEHFLGKKLKEFNIESHYNQTLKGPSIGIRMNVGACKIDEMKKQKDQLIHQFCFNELKAGAPVQNGLIALYDFAEVDAVEIPSGYTDPDARGADGKRSIRLDSEIKDIALLRLKEPRKAYQHLSGVKPERVVLSSNAPKLGDSVITFGYGYFESPVRNKNSKGEGLGTLQVKAFRVGDREAVFKNGGFTVPQDSFIMSAGQYDDGNVCQGDSGGPSMIEVNGRMEVVGVNSFSHHCLNYGSSTIVAKYKSWIEGVARQWKTPLYK